MPGWKRRLAILVAAAAVLPACGGGPHESVSSSQEVTPADPDIETFPSEGSTHVPPGTAIVYQTDPPTSGPHYAEFVAEGGFYSIAMPPPYVVHSMEHGGVIIYYSPAVTADPLAHLKSLADQHPGRYAQVVAEPRNDSTYPIILTAWTHRLRLTRYDAARIDGFIALFLGQGPEQAPM
jgi:hypothetical protein